MSRTQSGTRTAPSPDPGSGPHLPGPVTVPAALNTSRCHTQAESAGQADRRLSLLHERSIRHSDTLNEQLQAALNSRVVIEQAKGKLAERLGVDMDRAFSLLRDVARSRNRRLSELAQAFVDGTEPLTGPAHRQARLGSERKP